MDNIIKNETLYGERPLFGLRDTGIESTQFLEGESALKESRNIFIDSGVFKGNYPLWHVKKGVIENSEFTKECRSSVWNSSDLQIFNCLVNGVKFLRKCKDIKIINTKITSEECCWYCDNVIISNCIINGGAYFSLNSSNINISGVTLSGKYPCNNITNAFFDASSITGKDFLWHSKNIVVKNCKIVGNYLGWYSDNVTIIDSEIKGSQPFCYSNNITLINTTLIDANDAFEYSTILVRSNEKIKSIKNPINARIFSEDIEEIIFDDANIDPKKALTLITPNHSSTANSIKNKDI